MENGLLKKMYFKPGFKILVVKGPADISTILGDVSAISILQDELDLCQGFLAFVKNSTELLQVLQQYGSVFKDQVVWIAYPKKTSGIATDLKMEKWKELEDYELSPCGSASIDDTWTGIRIKPIDQVKASGVGNAQIKTNDFAEFIDVARKKVTVPPDLALLFLQYPQAAAFFQGLAYSHQKEYVLWILTAKQEKTRTSRLLKTIELLQVSKKNPTDK
ncbi:YdeI/OmpD-associated family protein [Pedobacter sp. MC2016-24]|uniref:YdeI/OmpD-associated family protein n=1 Tax=Pedobacter sp. MC2016-24 TaxID=2780090 RepID=UPI0018808049|nr:YdeI/OmpD-associated family protein [Pedobacter sp. MC2016-24]MBE9597718.1 YdeI/OmpD-associated family protein [Pedobacter sp. MC2016-24]